MKITSAFALATLLLVGSSNVGSQIAQADNSKWVCKTGPIWNGRSSGPRYVEGTTRDQAYAQAVESCKYSGQFDYCKSAITCWEQ